MAFCYCFQGPNTVLPLYLLSSGAVEQPHRTTTIKVYDRALYCLYLKCCYGCILYSFSEAIIISRKHTHHVQGLQPLSSPPQRALSLSSPIISGQHHCLNSYFLKCDSFYSCYHGHRRQGKLTEYALAHPPVDVKNTQLLICCPWSRRGLDSKLHFDILYGHG